MEICMKKFLIILILYTCSPSITFGQQSSDSYAQAEKEINAVYQKILHEYSSDKVFIKNLKASQRLWIQFRDAEVKARFPDRSPGYYGSVHATCISDLITQLTQERIKTLSLWLEGMEEGDVCAGSVRRKE